ncbi:bile acid:sodium symporter family protein [Enterobacter asburiae]|jgi:predicted Na+-dependent transporter|uniref:bile acid:sodium symporter family protein n=1 Tax=Enterobacter asburiae TaxID=61645 RepID=UPI0006473381|nr:bile acid:sodium symporter family protein [Enterobacter asburiae]
MLSAVTRLFPLWALLLSVLAYYTPATFTGIGPWVATLLMLIMFGMGVHLKIDDFKRVLSRPAPVAAGIFLHYLVIPIALGLVIHHLFPRMVKAVEPYLPAFSMVCILAIISAVVAGSASHIASVGFVVIIAVVLHNTIGLLGGYWGGKLFGFDESTCRTLAIEVGMQNSGLAAALGKIYFSPLAALPGALFSVWHNLSGSLLAGYWSGKPIDEQTKKDAVKQG